MPKTFTDNAGNVVVIHGKVGQVVKGDSNLPVRIEMRGKGKGMTVSTFPVPNIEAAARALHEAQRPSGARSYVHWEQQLPEYQAHMRNRVRLVLREALGLDLDDVAE
ncbi:MAG: hypothetical protein I4O49_16075 [Janthinobacterium lividum]|nr:hypothetical protein [Janthinobacterium lividum]